MGLGRRELEDQQRDNDTATTMLRLMLTASLAAAISAMPAADPQQMIYYSPTTSYVQPQVQYVQQPQVSTVAAEPKTVSYTPTTYVAAPAAEPLFFNRMMGGMGSYGWLGSNNMGGKADYGNYGERKYPTYGDYYRTHRYPINDGWMLWDEDLRDLDSKSNKIGSGKDGGR